MGMPAPKMKPPAEAGPVQVEVATQVIERKNNGQFAKGQSGNVDGKRPGTRNLNGHVAQAIMEYKVGNKSFLTLMLERALDSDVIMEKLMDKLLINATPEQQAGIINSFEAALQSVRSMGDDQQPETRTIAIKATAVNPVERLDTFLGEEDGQ